MQECLNNVHVPSPLPPHPLVKVGLKVAPSDSLLCLDSKFQCVPCRLNILRMDPCIGIHEIPSMDHDSLLGDVCQNSIHAAVRTPIRVHLTTGPKTSFDDWQKGGSVSSFNYLKVSPGRGELCGNNSKHPTVRPWPSTPMELKYVSIILSMNLHYITRQ